jgi:hypothetical protein
MKDFKPVGRHISQSEKEFLFLHGKKWCASCSSVLDLTLFSTNQKCCKSCAREYSNDWALRNKERRNQKRKEWKKLNREKINEQDRRKRARDKEKLNREAREKYQANQPAIRERKKSWYDKNKEKINAQRKLLRQKYSQDPLYVLAKRIRDRVRESFRRGRFHKTKTSEILGCDWETAKLHLESQFKEGMSWLNMGEWHIDHIKPLALATNEEELKSLCHYTNLQPLWAEENIRKGKKWED